MPELVLDRVLYLALKSIQLKSQKQWIGVSVRIRLTSYEATKENT